jgi:hypothetical protein
MNEKKAYIWKLAAFLHSQSMVMSGEELAEHLNRNSFLTTYGAEYEGGRGTYKLIRETWKWLHDDLSMPRRPAQCDRGARSKFGSATFSILLAGS